MTPASKGVPMPNQKLHSLMLKPRKSVSKGKGEVLITEAKVLIMGFPNLKVAYCNKSPTRWDFRKSKELESIIIKAGHEKWHSMSENEQGSYEKRLKERSLEFEKYYKIYKKLNENADEAGLRSIKRWRDNRAVTSDT